MSSRCLGLGLALAIVVCLFASPSWAAFGDFVKQGNNFASGVGTTLEVTTFDAAAGNLVVVVSVFDVSIERTVTVSDNVDSGNYSQAVTLHDPAAAAGGGGQIAIHYKVIVTGGSRTVTQTISGTGGTFRHIAVLEYAGPVNATPLDKTAAVLHSGTNPTVGPVTPDSDGQLIVGATGNASGVVYAAAGSFTERIEWGNNAQAQDFVQATAASVSAAWTADNAAHLTAMATFRPVAGGAPAPPQRSLLGVGQ